MAHDYIYAGTRAKMLERKLLSETQLELLTSAKSVAEMHKVLYDTFLASFLTKVATPEDITRAIDRGMLHAKETLCSIAPDPLLLDALWIKYDHHNIKTLVKGARAGRPDEDLRSRLSPLGTVHPDTLLAAYRAGTLSSVDATLADTVARAEKETAPDRIAHVIDRAYAERIVRFAREHNEPFIARWAKRVIDVLNLKAVFRTTLRNLSFTDVFLPGGTIAEDELVNPETACVVVRAWGGERAWREAFSRAEETGSSAPLEKVADEHLTDFLQDESRTVFSLASLYAYVHALKNNAQIIGSILTAKQSGMSERELRTILRRLYA